MPEISNNFRLGRMEKDLDDRLVPNGAYRDALNVEVATSEGSDVGALQKVLGNALISGLPTLTNATCIGSVRDTQNNKIYWFIESSTADLIAEYDGTNIDLILVDAGATAKVNGATSSTTTLVVDTNVGTIQVGDTLTGNGVSGDVTVTTVTNQNNLVLSSAQSISDNTDLTFKSVLKFNTSNLILGVNILDQVLYFTDNLNEPRRVDIEYWRAKTGTSLTTSTDLTADKITVIRKSPLNALTYTDLPSTAVSGAGTIYGDQVQILIDGNTSLALSTFTLNSFEAITGITFRLQSNGNAVSPEYLDNNEVTLTNPIGHEAVIRIDSSTGTSPNKIFKATLLSIDSNIADTELGNSVTFATRSELLQWQSNSPYSSDSDLNLNQVFFGTNSSGDAINNYLGLPQGTGNDSIWSTFPVSAFYTVDLSVCIVGAPTLSNSGGSKTQLRLFAQYSLDEGQTWNDLTKINFGSSEASHSGVLDADLQTFLASSKTLCFTHTIAAAQYSTGTNVRYRLKKTGTTSGLISITNVKIDDIDTLEAAQTGTIAAGSNLSLRKNDGTSTNLTDVNPISSGMIIEKVTGDGIPFLTRVESVDFTNSIVVLDKPVTVSTGDHLTFKGTYSAISSTLTEYDAVAKEALGKFQEKFPTFSYRYKYTNNQYSTFAPFSLPAFVPGNFRYLTKDGFNAGMLNSITKITLTGWTTDISSQFSDTANSLIDEIDILYKTSNDQNVYVVDTIKKSGGSFSSTYEVGDNEIYKVLDNIQLLRNFDSVPKRALAQEIIGNRLLYANYTESFNYTGNIVFTIKTITRADPFNQKFSLKSNRTYQFGIVLQDTFGRKTPVFTGENSSKEIDKENSIKNIQFLIKATSTSLPSEITHFKYFIKEISKEYYNIAISNYYDDGEGFAYLAIPSADRNKVSENDYLVFKKQNGTDLSYDGTQDENRFKVIDIKNDPPQILNRDIAVTNSFGCGFGDKFGSQTALVYKKAGMSPVNGFNKIQIAAMGTSNYITADPQALLKPGAKIRFKAVSSLRYTKAYEISSVRTAGNAGSTLTAEVTFKNFFTEDVDQLYDDDNKILGKTTEFVTESETIGNSNFDGKFFVKIKANKILKDNFNTYIDEGDFHVLGSTYTVPASNTSDIGSYKISPSSGTGTTAILTSSNTFNISTTLAEGHGDSKYEDDPFFNNISTGNYIRISDTNLNNSLKFSNYYEITSVTKSGGGSAVAVFTVTLATNPLVSVTTSDVVRIEILNVVKESDSDSSNPAVFEVEPENGLLDLYYETQETFPISLLPTSDSTATAEVFGAVSDSTTVVVDTISSTLIADMLVTGTGISGTVKINTVGSHNVSSKRTLTLSHSVTLDNNTELTFTKYQALSYANSINFGNGVESDRIRDDFNAPVMGKGVRVSTVIEDVYAEETLTNRFIFSQIYNSGTGINRLNQFIIADKITKDINPSHGSIQIIKTRDTDLLALCEDKCFRVQANKDALFTADGNTQVTASTNVLGQIIPYVGEYGISKNPESFAQYGFRAYFTDKERGVVLRLSRDGLSEISSLGMSDFFSDKLANVTSNLFGSYDDRKNSYNLSFTNQANSDPTETISFNERINGWTSRMSFVPETAISLNNNYFSFKAGSIYKHHDTSSHHSKFYGVTLTNKCTVKIIMNQPIGQVKRFKTLNYLGNLGWLLDSITTSESVGAISSDGFIKKEGKFFATLTGSNSDSSSLNADELQVEGLGTISGVSGNVLTFSNGVNSNLQIGDNVYFLLNKDAASYTSLGTATAKTATTVTVSITPSGSITTPENKFVLFDKGGVANQSGLLGFFAEVELKHTTTTAAELFSVGSRIV